MRGASTNQLCLDYYAKLVAAHGIEPGHAINHVIKVEKYARAALDELRRMKGDSVLKNWARHYGDESMLDIPDDAERRVMVAALFHEVGDKKLTKPKEAPLADALSHLPDVSKDFAEDVCKMVDYCSAGKWGDRVEPGTRLYQLLVRWADRAEATGYIGIARTLLYGHSIRETGYQLCHAEAEFPTTMDELQAVAPRSRWEAYSTGTASKSVWGHFMDKIRHINGDCIPVPVLSARVDAGQKIVDQFILDFTNKNDRRFDLELIIANLDSKEYKKEICALHQMGKEADAKWVQ